MSEASVPGREYGRSSEVYVHALVMVSGSIAASVVAHTSCSNSARSSRAGMYISTGREGSTVTSSGAGEVEVATVSALSSRSEEHTSELQSRFELVCRLLLEKE